jgi:NADPH:quinone reductase-like Zn-dependent oxidoreductase
VRAVTVAEGDLTFVEHADPEPGESELLVQVRAAGINAADLMQRRGLYAAPPGSPPDIPGLELAGVVLARGRRATRFAVGDRVMAVVGGGAQAELAVVDERCALAVPPSMTWEEAGAFPEAFSTAHDALWAQCNLSSGERVLVTGAAGGVGTAGVQLCAATGAEAVASVRRAELHTAVMDLGAVAAAGPDEALSMGPFDVVLELVGGAGLAAVLSQMRISGRIAVIGVGAGGRVELDLLTIMQRRLCISGSTLRARSLMEKATVATGVERHVLPLLRAGRLRVPVTATYPMDHVADAYERFAAGGKLGKVVLVASDLFERP